jgi:colanic acid/amylovoran biosynthesis protein
MNNTKPIEVLIVNFHSTLNAGDSALLWLNLRQLMNIFPKANFAALVNYPNESFNEYFPKLTVLPSPFALVKAGSGLSNWIKIIKLLVGCMVTIIGLILPMSFLSKSHSNWLKIAHIYRSVDVIAAVSGAQLVSFGKYSWPLIVSSIPIIFAHIFHKPLYVMPQSIGPFRWEWEKKLVRAIYTRSRIVFLRDKISMRLASEIGIPENKLNFSSDPGFSLPMASRDQAIEIMSGYGYIPGKKSIGITVISRLSKAFERDKMESYYRTFANSLDRFSQVFDVDIYIFDQVTGPSIDENDGIAAEFLLNTISEKQGRILHVQQRLNPMELKACYSLMDMFIASRLHSGIFAMSSGVPTLFIGYNPKTRGVLEAIGMDQWMVELTNIDSDCFWELLCKTWENRKNIADLSRPAVLNCQQDFDRVSQQIAADYFNANKS